MSRDLLINIAETAARAYARRDYHKLTNNDLELVRLLVQGGYIRPNNPFNGFIGDAIDVEERKKDQ